MCMHSTERFRVYCFITGSTNCQPSWLRTRSAEIRHEEKYFDCWSYHAARWTVNKTTWRTVPKQPKSVFWKPNHANRGFGFWIFLRSVRFSSVFRKPISDIFIGFRTPLDCCGRFLHAGWMRLYQTASRQWKISVLNNEILNISYDPNWVCNDQTKVFFS